MLHYNSKYSQIGIKKAKEREKKHAYKLCKSEKEGI